MIVNEGYTLKVAQSWKEHAYYDRAEQDDWMKCFWQPEGIFRRLFERLDTRVVVELACGRGRHTARLLDTPQLRNKIEHVHLIDINEENIRYCGRRFADLDFVSTVINNGYDFQPIQDKSVSAIFCYDAMVHFELDAVISYLHDAFRVLVPGGRALFHHSNYDRSPGADSSANPCGRNFMSKNLFAHVASRCGFKVLEQSTLNWEMERKLDCISLIEKPIEKSEESDQITSQKQLGHAHVIKRVFRVFRAPPSAIARASLLKCRRWVRSMM